MILCWLNVVPSFMTLFQHWTNIMSVYLVACDSTKTRRLANVVLLLSHCRRQWASNKLALDERLSR